MRIIAGSFHKMFRELMARYSRSRLWEASDAMMIADSFESFASGADPDFIDQGSRLIS